MKIKNPFNFIDKDGVNNEIIKKIEKVINNIKLFKEQLNKMNESASALDIKQAGEQKQLGDRHTEEKQKIQENKKLIVSVKSHEKTRYKDYVAVIDQLKRANAKRISIAETGD